MADSFWSRIENNMGNMVIGAFVMATLALVLIQIVSFMITQIWPTVTQLKIGSAIGLLALVSIITVSLVAALDPSRFSRGAWVAVLLMVVVVIFLFWIFPKLAPQFFQPAMSSLKVQTMSVLGI